MSWQAHLPIVPIVLPLAAGALMLLLDERHYRVKATISIAALFLLLGAAIELVRLADAPLSPVYALGNWPAPYGIVLVVDRLSAALVLLATVLGLAAMVFALPRWQHAGPRFHSLLQFLLMGLNGAFLTGDLFNLFVFFELLLAASYALALHGTGTVRVRSSLHYIIINLAASLLFLIGISLIYGSTGTLNLAHLAQRIPFIAPEDRVLVETGAAVLAIAFLVKAGMWPLGFWLPSTYSTACAPAAALFSILSKVGFYAVLRIWLLFFGGSVGGELLFYGGMATLVFGAVGMLASQDLGRLAGYSLLVSSGTLLATISRGDGAVTGAALFYLVASTLGIAALFLLVELVQRAREPGADILAVTAEIFGLAEEGDEPEEETGTAIPAAMAVLGLTFTCCALVIAGLPPLAGFVAKATLLAAVLEPEPISAGAWALLALLTMTGLAAIIALGRAGVSIFWAGEDRSIPRVRLVEITPIAALLALCLALSAAPGEAMRYLNDAAAALHAPQAYIDSVLTRQ